MASSAGGSEHRVRLVSGYVWDYSVDVETLRATLEQVAPEAGKRAAVSGSSVTGADQSKLGEPAGSGSMALAG
ncbi:hypothetical protein [Saccharothrix carnea]|uniref:hypothetical protein n=1 Tax=Saccharothrix carnea TaxID=1280637 RepID=UPI0011B245AD|nr:hypothetical protein [Saccharothrix carnea]